MRSSSANCPFNQIQQIRNTHTPIKSLLVSFECSQREAAVTRRIRLTSFQSRPRRHCPNAVRGRQNPRFPGLHVIFNASRSGRDSRKPESGRLAKNNPSRLRACRHHKNVDDFLEAARSGAVRLPSHLLIKPNLSTNGASGASHPTTFSTALIPLSFSSLVASKARAPTFRSQSTPINNENAIVVPAVFRSSKRSARHRDQ